MSIIAYFDLFNEYYRDSQRLFWDIRLPGKSFKYCKCAYYIFGIFLEKQPPLGKATMYYIKN